ncbi:hypothetical protein Droror1_Dr00013980, partial [Drosera rotundifolia]
IEDVLAHYISLVDHDRDKNIRDREYLMSILNKIRTENDIAIQLANPAGTNSSNLEELQAEVSHLQNQIAMAEEQLRTYEPDLSAFRSIGELEACEKNLVETLSRVSERKKYLSSNQYDASSIQIFLDSDEGVSLPASFGSEVINSWLPKKENNQREIFAGSDASISVSHSSTDALYESLLREEISQNVNGDPNNMVGAGGSGCQLSTNNNSIGTHQQDVPLWHHGYTSTDLLSALMAQAQPTSLPLTKEMGEGTMSCMAMSQPAMDMALAGPAAAAECNFGAGSSPYETEVPHLKLE